MTLTHAASASALALLLAGPAFAQGAIVGTDALDDRIEEVEEDIQDELTDDDDPNRFGRAEFAPGLSGSMSLGYSGTTGNTENQDLSVVGRLRYGGDVVSQQLGFGLEFGEATDPETDETFKTDEEVFVVYDATRDLAGQLYAFGLGSYRNDDFDTLQQDAFVGAGLGYRVVNTPRFAWRLQAGPGVRWSEDQFGEEETEVAGIAASRFFYVLSDTVSVSNATDVLYSEEAGTLVRNDLGANFAVSEQLSTRVSYLTDYNSDPAEGFESTDNRLGVALVFGF